MEGAISIVTRFPAGASRGFINGKTVNYLSELGQPREPRQLEALVTEQLVVPGSFKFSIDSRSREDSAKQS